MSKLVIVESPAKAKTIKKYLGSGYDVIASMGHVRDLPKSRLGVDVKHDFKPKYEIIKGKEELVDTPARKWITGASGRYSSPLPTRAPRHICRNSPMCFRLPTRSC